MTRVLFGFLVALTLSSCSSNGASSINTSPNRPVPGRDGDAVDPNGAEVLKSLLCSPTKAEAGVEECISPLEELDKLIELPRRLSTWGSLETNEFVDALLDRKAFRERFRLSDREVQCLKTKMCMEK